MPLHRTILLRSNGPYLLLFSCSVAKAVGSPREKKPFVETGSKMNQCKRKNRQNEGSGKMEGDCGQRCSQKWLSKKQMLVHKYSICRVLSTKIAPYRNYQWLLQDKHRTHQVLPAQSESSILVQRAQLVGCIRVVDWCGGTVSWVLDSNLSLY